MSIELLAWELHRKRLRSAERNRLAREARRVLAARDGTGRQLALYWMGRQFTQFGAQLQTRSGLQYSIQVSRPAECNC